MRDRSRLSRRTLVAGVAISPTFPLGISGVEASPSDRELVAFGREFDAITAELDAAIEGKPDLEDGLLKRLSALDATITNMPARTAEGLRVKARAACWALLGDLDPSGEATTDRRMALSIVRDLIRLHDPQLEKPGALKELAESK